MPISIGWDEMKIDGQEKSIMRWTFDGSWTWSELMQLAAHSHNMVASVAPRKVDVIVVSGPKGYILPSGNALAEVGCAIDMRASNLNRIVVVTTPGIFAALTRTLIKTARVSSRLMIMVSSLEEAYELVGPAAPSQANVEN
jgi:hypothetical protein